MSQDQRKYPRVPGENGIRYRPIRADNSTGEYREGVLENLGLSGVFIATDDPLPNGSLVDLEFQISQLENQRSIRAQVRVRWDRRLFLPRGMGLEFVEFEGQGKEQLELWLRKIVDAGGFAETR